MCAHNGQLGVALTLGVTLPSHSAIQRWFGEPVRAVIVPTSTFQANKRGFPALPKAHQAVLLSFFQLNVQVQLSCNAVTWSCRLLREATPLPSHTTPRCCFSAWLVTHHKFCSCCFSGQAPSPLLDPLFCCFLRVAMALILLLGHSPAATTTSLLVDVFALLASLGDWPESNLCEGHAVPACC